MFTGLIEEVGEVAALDVGEALSTMTIRCRVVTDEVALGDSIAVNGVCLTVTAFDEGSFTVEMMGETMSRSALGGLETGDPVNLERAMLAGARLGGHMVQGHVDGVSRIVGIEPHEQWTTVTYELTEALAPYVVEKGSITVDGTSLTVMAVGEGTFSVGLIPHTMGATTHGARKVGDPVNLEVDVIAKYVERQLAGYLRRLAEDGS